MDDPRPPYIVFSSSGSRTLDAGAWDAHAQRFFKTRLRGAGDGRVRVIPEGEPEGERRLVVRESSAADMALAEEGERRAGGGGLIHVARRCGSVWLVTRETEDDRIALRLAMILASVHLGPIVDPRGPDLFGVKTARAKVDAPSA
jgi:hypothetical protein